MFSIEHDFDATVVTLVDEGSAPLREDVRIDVLEDGIVIEQLDDARNLVQRIWVSHGQLRDLAAALDLPEGVYRLDKGVTEKL